MKMLRPTRSIFVVFPLIFFACVDPAHADWVIGANATDSDGTHAMADCLFGFWYTNATAEHAYTVQIASQVSVLDEMNAPCKLLFRDFTTHPYDYWQLLVHAGPQYAEDTVHFKLWTFSGPTWDTYQSNDVFLRVVDDPMGRYSPGQILWQGSIGPETSRENPTFEVEIWANKTPDPWMDGLRLEFGSPDAYPCFR